MEIGKEIPPGELDGIANILHDYTVDDPDEGIGEMSAMQRVEHVVIKPRKGPQPDAQPE